MSRLWQAPAILVAGLLLGAPLLAFLGLAGPGAFYFFIAGMAVGLICTIGLAASAAFASATGRAWRGAAVRATVVPMVLTLGVLGIGYGSGGGNHPIHDVTTDVDDTLQFTPDVAALEALPMERADVLSIQQELYPDIEPLIVGLSPAAAFAAAERAAAAMPGWEIVSTDPASGRIEAVATSRIFHFADDVVIRVQPAGDSSRIDVRSRSRMGRSDLGANSERIRLYLAAVQASL